MRTLVILLALLAVRAEGAERTWTIARDVYTAEAELIAVRGDLVYLKIDGRVEEIPLERLSAADQNYIASLSLAPIMPGPAAEPANYSEEMPLPGDPDLAPVDLELNAPDLAPAHGGAPIRERSVLQGSHRVDRYGRVVPPQPGVAANYLSPQGNWGENVNPYNRRYARPPQQGSANPNARSQRNDQEDRPGLFGARARRTERQRAAAGRDR